MAVVLRRNLGTALTYDQLDDNFVDYTTFRDKFDQSEWTGSSNGYFLYFDNPTGKIKVKALDSDDLSAGFNSNFNSSLATKTTNDVTEGSSNLYYTSARANADFDTRLATKSTTNLSEGSNKYYTDARVDARIGAINTDSLSEGSSNLYYTDSRADARVGNATLQTLANVDTATASDDGKFLKYDHSSSRYVYGTGTVSSTDVITEGSSNLYFTNARADVRVNAVLPDTGSLAEGSNLYFTNARADARITNALVDEDNMASNSATKIPSQQSVKAYVDSQILTKDNTDEITEGSTNLYFTNTRADARISNATLQTLSNVEAPAGVGDNGKLLMYRNDGGSINRYELVQFSTTDQLPEGSSNLYLTTANFTSLGVSINALSDVNTSGAANGKILKYNGSAWVIADDSGGHTDTDTLSQGSQNKYWSTSGETVTLTNLDDVDAVTGAQDQYILYYNHSTSSFKWKASAGGPANTDGLSEGSSNLYFTNARADARITASSLSDISNVHTTAPTDGQVLTWDNANSYWKPATPSGGGGGSQNLFSTIASDSGSTTANSTTDTLTVSGGNDISTAISGDTVTINQSRSRTTASVSTGSITNNTTSTPNIVGFKSYLLMSIQVSHQAWVRLYTDSTSRTNDSSRSQGADPSPGAGVIAEVITTGAQTILMSPGVFGFNNEGSPTTAIPLSVKNISGSSANITVTLTLLKLED